MDLHGLGVMGAQVTTSFKNNEEKMSSAPIVESTALSIQSTPTNTDHRCQDFDPHLGAKPYSPFYRHGSPAVSQEQLTLETKTTERDCSTLRDIESLGAFPTRNECARRSKLWEAEKPPRTCLQSLSRPQRMALKAAVAVVTVGTMIGIALGITAAVGGASWRQSTQQVALGG
ncbi:hypothetical protein POX_b02483 [Penicillium oxalicum]|uniref:Uncharacterized protein n=1 Tax=Penicillium oxalicum (strain 114-2 / CGMCC 5302) TaxID=933388 RepID=S8B735_PENO1|nr:hypothetical protein POX_b02483 [Penicillium oxalicum]EPS30512.1 hypothetical protein PDE_05463 [Penicillium oxalicum 114-2]KAI2792445.1 hypothetical protein POX_b02483 [Penicillium oxalicum]